MGYRSRLHREQTGRCLLLACSAVCFCTVVLITIFIFAQGIPVFKKVPLGAFLFSTNWSPSDAEPHYGVFSFIVASIVVTTLSLLFATPIAISTAIYLAVFAKGRKAAIIRQSIELLAGIPSIIFGLFGIAVIVPFVRTAFGGNGYSLLSASLVLAIMILPTIINISEVSLCAVPAELKEASIALGATDWQTITRVMLPAARGGITASLVMALGRAIGETTAVLLVGGNAPLFPESPLSMGRTLTMNIVTDMSYAEGVHMSALFATAMLLFCFILVLNLLVRRKS